MKLLFSTYSLVLLFLFVLFFFLSKTTLVRKPRRYLLFVSLCLSIMAFLFNPIKGWETNGNYTDLYRFYSDMKIFQTVGWNGNSAEFRTEYNTIPVIKVLVYSIAQIGVFGLLASLTCAFVYGLFGKLALKLSRDEELRPQVAIMAFLMFVALANYKAVITNIRMPIGMVIFLIVSYYDLIREKRNLWVILGYISLLGIHSVFIIFIVVRVLSILMKKYSAWIICLIAVTSGTMLTYIVGILQRFESNAYVDSILYKIAYYTVGTKSDYSEPSIVFLGVIKIVTMIVMILYLSKHKVDVYNRYKRFIEFGLLFSMVCIGTAWNYYLFMRMTNYLWLLIPMLYIMLKCENREASHGSRFSLVNKNTVNFVLYSTLILHLVYYFLSYQYRVLCF